MKEHTISHVPDQADLAAVTDTFRALSDPTRVRIVLLLAAGERTVGQLVEAIGSPQSTVSRHLSVLRSTHLVAARRQGTSMRYEISDAHVGDMVAEAFFHAEHKRRGLPGHLTSPHGGSSGGR